MHKILFLLCPTDCLESIINDMFGEDVFFYSSLGNSMTLKMNTLECIKKLIIEYQIEEVSFVLSTNNDIFKDAIGKENFIDIFGLRNIYSQIHKEKSNSELFWPSDLNFASLISYYLNTKIKELQMVFEQFKEVSVEISGRIYDRHDNSFKKIYHDLVCVKRHYLN